MWTSISTLTGADLLLDGVGLGFLQYTFTFSRNVRGKNKIESTCYCFQSLDKLLKTSKTKSYQLYNLINKQASIKLGAESYFTGLAPGNFKFTH